MSECNQQFDNFQQWVNKASSWLTRRPDYHEVHFRAICIDSKGRICTNGKDFKRAESEKSFPIRWWWPDQEIKELNSHEKDISITQSPEFISGVAWVCGLICNWQPEIADEIILDSDAGFKPEEFEQASEYDIKLMCQSEVLSEWLGNVKGRE